MEQNNLRISACSSLLWLTQFLLLLSGAHRNKGACNSLYNGKIQIIFSKLPYKGIHAVGNALTCKQSAIESQVQAIQLQFHRVSHDKVL